MPTQIVVPQLGESIVEATVSRWLKKEGEAVSPGEIVVELETDKANLPLGAEHGGVLAKIERKEGEDVKIGEVLGIIDQAEAEPVQSTSTETEPPKASPSAKPAKSAEPESAATDVKTKATPSARRMAQEHDVDLSRIKAADPDRITKQDVQAHIKEKKTETPAPAPAPPPAPKASATKPPATPVAPSRESLPANEERIRMSRRRRTIAERLVEAQRTAAMLTTFNEIDMSAVMDLRKRHKETFKQRFGVGLGIVSFFVKASVRALQDFRMINAEIDGDEIVLKNYYDIGIAVGAAEGLVVPVLRGADRMSFAEIESSIKEFAQKSENKTLTIEELRGGTFTITNGGVYGSMMSTPILNPPQAAILGLHKIEERPIALNGEIIVRPMMYVALSYDHRLVDGRESVQFLVRIKELVEDPGALMLGS